MGGANGKSGCIDAASEWAWAAALVIVLALAGCQNARTHPTNLYLPADSAPYTPSRSTSDLIVEWPMKFTGHNFGTSCYSVYGCRINYGYYWRDEPSDRLRLSSASIGDKYPGNLSASYGPIRNFPPPAIVTWRSKDSTSLRAEIDMAEIFKDQLVLHNLKREEVSSTESYPLPEIILETNDRTINVYIRATIWTKKEQRPGQPLSNNRDDLIKAFSRTY